MNDAHYSEPTLLLGLHWTQQLIYTDNYFIIVILKFYMIMHLL